MATYASTSNPFLENPANSRQDSSQMAKSAPGMARPQSSLSMRKCSKDLLTNCNGGIDQNIQPNFVTKQHVSIDTEVDRNNNITIRWLDKNFSTPKNNEIKKNLSIVKEDTKVPLEDDLEDEIKKTCNALVEEASRKLAIGDEFEEIKIDPVESSLSDSQICSSNHDIKTCKFDTEYSELSEEEDETETRSQTKDRDVPPMEQDIHRHQHIELIKKLRLQLRDLEKYAYERGDLDLVPTSVLAERQTVIIDALKEKLSLNLDNATIEKLELNELKKQIDKEIHDLVDPIITKEHLLTQLRTQLTDLERYISHLHGTMGKKNECSCHLHGCSTSQQQTTGNGGSLTSEQENPLIGNDALTKTTKLIRTLVAQLMCSDLKIQEFAKKEQALDDSKISHDNKTGRCDDNQQQASIHRPIKESQFHDGATWTLHIDRVILATDSLVNLFTLEPKYHRGNDKLFDESVVESIVRRQLVPAIRDTLTYGLMDASSFPHSNSYTSFLFDPYYLLSSLTCFPSSQKSTNENETIDAKLHIWNIIQDYYNSRIGPNFKQSSVKTLSQSFNLTPSINGPIKITSKQALLIAVDDIIDKLSKCKPNGPESHFRAFVYIALNQCKLSIWLRLVFKNKSVIKKYYHNFSFVSQSEKMEKLLITLDALSQIEFKLCTDMESIDHFISAF